MNTLLILILTLLNALFAMSEMALTASRKALLVNMAAEGDKGAKAALALMAHPTNFLSTVQVGITSIGMLNGIVGEAAFSGGVSIWLESLGLSHGAAEIMATALVIVTITYITIIFGELVPKRIGQLHPEAVAKWISRPMQGVAMATKPFVRLLSLSTQGVLHLLRIDTSAGRTVTQEEISASLEEGLESGLIESHEHQMVQNVFRLDDRPLTSLMLPRSDIQWLNFDLTVDQALAQIGHLSQSSTAGAAGVQSGSSANAAPGAHPVHSVQGAKTVVAGGIGDAALNTNDKGEVEGIAAHSWYPVCRGSLDDVVGVVSVSRLLGAASNGHMSISKLAEAATFVPETLSGLELLEQFRARVVRMVFVVDEYGVVQGLMTPLDLLEAITGELRPDTQSEAWAMQREDGSWLLDGLMPVDELKNQLDIKALPGEDRGLYNTLAGLLMFETGNLPNTVDKITLGDWLFEVVDLDGRRIDKVLALLVPAAVDADDVADS
jgi:putative hemolysin